MFSLGRQQDRYVTNAVNSKLENKTEATDKISRMGKDLHGDHTSEFEDDELESLLPSISPRNKDYVKLLQGMKLILESLLKENNKDIDRVSHKNKEHERMIRSLIRMIITPNVADSMEYSQR